MNTKSFRVLLALYNKDENMSMQHWDVKQAFVNAPLEETVYVHQIKGQDFKTEQSAVWNKTSSTCVAEVPITHTCQYGWEKKSER